MFILQKQAARLYYKVRHRRGHGIHSPFVYNFIVNVVENKSPFYAYADIEECIQTKLTKKYATKKFNKLVFKTINYFQAKTIVEIGSGKGINTLYACGPSKSIECVCVETIEKNRKVASTLLDGLQNKTILMESLPKTNQTFDCVIIDSKLLQEYEKQIIKFIFSNTHEKSVVILNNIRTNEHVYSLVEKVRKDERVCISLDLYKVGIFFFDRKYYKRNYSLSF